MSGHTRIGCGAPVLSDIILHLHRFRLVGLKIRLLVQRLVEALFVERALPFGDDDSRQTIADQVGEGPRLRHEAVDAEDQGDACDRDRADRGKGRGQNDEAGASDSGRSLGGEQENQR